MARRDVLAWVIARTIWGEALWSRDQMEECYRIADAVTPVFTQTDDGAAVAAQSMGGSLPPAVPSSPAGDCPCVVLNDEGECTACGERWWPITGQPSSQTGSGPAATIGGQPGPVVPRRFQLYRHTDISHVSGIGVVAWGVLFPDGAVAIRWHGAHPSTVAWGSVDDAIAIHGHSGATEVRWIDDEPITLWPADPEAIR